MASQTRKNRHCADLIPSGTEPSLAGLPEELLLDILQRVDITSVHRLRQTSKYFVRPCAADITDKLKLMKVLYVHPSPTSVQHAITICQSDVSSQIEEICFVSKNFHFRNDCEAVFVPAGPAAFPWPVRGPLEEDAPRTNFWAQVVANLQGNSKRKFQMSYRDLLSELAALKTTRLSFSEVCDKPGFNMISAQRIASWRETIEEREAEDPLNPQTTFKFADIDALASVLSDPRFTFTNLRITHELAYEGSGPALGMTLIGGYRPLTHADLTISHGGPVQSLWGCHYGDFLSSTASTLIELKIGFQYRDHAPKDGNLVQEIELAGIFDTLQLPQLQRLEIRRFSAPDSNLPADNPNAVMLQHIDLGNVLAQRCRNLRFLQLTNVVPILVGQTVQKPWMMKDTVLNIGTSASEIKGLDEGTRAWDINFSV